MQLAQLYPELTVIGIPVCLIHGVMKCEEHKQWEMGKI